jgi:enolase
MNIKKVGAKIILDSRGKKTIQVFIQTDKGKFVTSSPSGKSTGKFEVKSYGKSLKGDVNFINKLDTSKLYIERFEDLKKVERVVGKNLGGNSLFVLEASLLKALSKDLGMELYQFLGLGNKIRKIIRPVGNSIGGGLHSKGVYGKKPDFQEFLFIAHGKSFTENVKINKLAYNEAGKILKARKRNDEGAWETGESNEFILDVMKRVRNIINNKYNKKIDIGLDVASSGFFKKTYNYKNPKRKFSSEEQLYYLLDIVEKIDVLYIEDGFNETDFSSFRKLLVESGKMIVGDDLTTTNPKRLKKAIEKKSINAIIVKPNQIGSLLKVKEVIEICKENKIKTIISHRSGETLDDTIADLAVGWNVDFIKTGIYGKFRESKLKRLIKIEKKLRK